MKRAKRKMTKEAKKRTINTLIGLTATALIGGAGALTLAFTNGLQGSLTGDVSYISVNEIWNETDQEFDKTNFQTLLNYITGVNNAGMTKINELASRSERWTAEDMRMTVIGNKKQDQDISVRFGELDWTPTYLSQDDYGNPILTLWLTSNEQDAFSGKSESAGLYHGFVYSDTTKKTGLYSDWSADWSGSSLGTSYPSNMYGTSYIRSVTLNNGGKYAISDTDLIATDPGQDSNSVFAKFTMTTNGNKLPTFIVEPANVKWQEMGQSTSAWSSPGYSLPNENWSEKIPNTGNYGSTTYKFYSVGSEYSNYANKGEYNSAWKNDKLWLPSMWETGLASSYNHAGMWYTSINQRKNYDGSTEKFTVSHIGKNENSNNVDTIYTSTWMRSGVYNTPSSAFTYSPSGQDLFNNIDRSLAVRPALHLNLEAVHRSLNFAEVDEIWNESSSTFNKTNFQTLLDYVAGENSTSIDKINQLAETKRTANDMKKGAAKGKTAGNDIVVRLGGLEWTPTYLSKTADGYNTILTLWLTNSTQEAWKNGEGGNRSDLKYNQGQYYGFLYAGLYSAWSSGWTSETTQDGTANFYPDNMYGTSYVRSVTLNNGGKYATSNTVLSSDPGQSSSSVFAKFTMDDIQGSLTNYIVEPAQIAWQAQQSIKTDAQGFTDYTKLQNDEYAPETAGNEAGDYSSAAYNYAEHTGYDAWKNDKIWLPSMTETGCSDSMIGMWNTSREQRRNYNGYDNDVRAGVGDNVQNGMDWSNTTPLLRSGVSDSAKSGYCLDEGGNAHAFHSSNYEPNVAHGNAFAVRPALHLNLSAIALELGLQEVEPPSGGESWIDHAAGWFDNEDINKAHLSDSTLGTKEKPYEIRTAAQLALLAKDVNQDKVSFSGKYFKQTGDIRLGGYDWAPIGEATEQYFEFNSFKGNYDGHGHKIDGLTITTSAITSTGRRAENGLFGAVSGTIKNVTIASGIVQSNMPIGRGDMQAWSPLVAYALSGAVIANCTNYANITKGNAVGDGAGGIVGVTAGKVTITNCINYGNIQGRREVGGILGDDDINCSTIINCKNYGNITTIGGSNVGGIIGAASSATIVENCISESSISGDWDAMGSLAGYFEGTMKNCAAYGFLTYDNVELYTYTYQGALVGIAGDGLKLEGCSFVGSVNVKDGLDPYYGIHTSLPATDVTIKCCYSWINQSGYYSNDLGEWADYFVFVDRPLQKSLYWVNKPSTQSNTDIVDGMNSLGFTCTNEVDPSTLSWVEFAAKKFDNELSGHLADSSVGTVTKPYEIKTAAQLALLAKDVNNGNSYAGKYFKQTGNIDLSGHDWTPIGHYSYQPSIQKFEGNFNGGTFKVDGLTIDNKDDNLATIGLFGYVSGGKIENVNLASGSVISVTCVSEENCGAGMIGKAENAQIIDCTNKANFNDSNNVAGGIVGFANTVTIKNCYNYGNVNGGIVGIVLGVSTIDGCYNHGNAECGIVFTVWGRTYEITIQNCYNRKDVTIAGILGIPNATADGVINIINCHNKANVNGTGLAGGIIGASCIPRSAGGSVSSYPSVTMENCSSEGTITGENFIGGLAGMFYGTMKNCAATGKIVCNNSGYNPSTLSSGLRAGMIVGLLFGPNSTIEGCSFDGTFIVNSEEIDPSKMGGGHTFEPYFGWSTLLDKPTSVTVKCCYAEINGKGFYTSESDDWGEYYYVGTDNKPKQKTVYIDGSGLEDTAEIIKGMKELGYQQYTQTLE